jgi:hypothetical protein
MSSGGQVLLLMRDLIELEIRRRGLNLRKVVLRILCGPWIIEIVWLARAGKKCLKVKPALA